jgi:hypothetical protein
LTSGKSPGFATLDVHDVVAVGTAADRRHLHARAPERRQRLRELELASCELAGQHLQLRGPRGRALVGHAAGLRTAGRRRRGRRRLGRGPEPRLVDLSGWITSVRSNSSCSVLSTWLSTKRR